MVRSAIADEYLLTYLTSLASKHTYSIGLVLGQTFSGKDCIIYFAKTPPLEEGDDSEQKQIVKELKSISEINENLLADHARQVTRMLPGGTYVLGVFVITPEDISGTSLDKIKVILQTMHKQLESPKYLYGNATAEKLFVNYNSKTLRYSCKAYDVLKGNMQPADLKFNNKASGWKAIECNLDVDYLKYLKKTEFDWPLQKHIETVLNNLHDNLQVATYFFDGEFKDADDSLEITKKSKTKGGQVKPSQDIDKRSKSIKATIYQSVVLPSNKEILESNGQLRIVGQVACKIWLLPTVTIKEASEAVKEDILRSLAARLEMHWDSLTEEENSEGINCVHEPPRRVLIELPNNNITLSDYLFPGEGPEDAKSSLEELLDIEIKGKLKIQDVEGQTDISLYDSALETASEESLPNKLTKNGNIFLYLAIVLSLIVVVIAVLLQLSR